MQDDNVGLANSYVWTLLLFAGTCLFSLTFPLVSPIFACYMACKCAIDTQNFRLFYTAREHQPMLLKTGVQVAMVCPLLGQATVAIYHMANDVNEWVELREQGRRDEFEDLPQTLWAGGLLIVNSTMLLMAQVDLNNKQQVVLSLTKEFSPPGGVFHSPCSGREELSQGDHQVRVLKQQ